MFSDPTENIGYLGLESGMKVVDVGAGSGHHAILIAKAVGEEGIVYAIDVQKDLLARLKSEATSEHLNNLEIVWTDIEKSEANNIRTGSVDRVFMSNVLYQIYDKQAAVGEVVRMLRPGGRIVVIDWAEASPMVAHFRDQLMLQVEAERLLVNRGLEKVSEWNPGDHHYGLVFKKN